VTIVAVPFKDPQTGKFTKGRFSRKVYGVRLTVKADAVFRQICEERDRNPTELVREIVEQWLESQKKSLDDAGGEVSKFQSA